ncbi:hypothetical protein T09_8650 [Trichinella sp. T9]|nr:hypothetical protein T09_8650 [Trichinella sp. T9]
MVQECKSTESMPVSQADSSIVRLPNTTIGNGFTMNLRQRSIPIQLCRRLRNSIIYDQTAFRGLILNAVNYETALTILNEKYGDSQLLIEEHLKSLQNLPVITNQWDLKRLEKFVSDMEINIRGLETLKTPPVVYQAVLMPLILSRLPREISVEWKRQNPNRQKDIQDYEVEKYQCFHGEKRSQFFYFYPTGRLFHENSVLQSHYELRRGHPLASCKSKVKCRTEECSKRHHPLIHPNQDKSSVSENQPNTSAIKTVNPHAVYHHEQLDELGRLAPEDPRPVMEIYDEFASNASTSLDTAAYLPTWNQVPHTMYNRRARRYPRLDGWMGKSAGTAAYC